jgi:hypothetical protein
MDLVFGVARPMLDHEDLVLRTRTVSRQYPGVPREGDMVDLDDDGLYAAPVDSILWDADGSVLLVFTDVTEVSDSDLDEWGFTSGEFELMDEAEEHAVHMESLSDLDTTFRATPPQELENLRSVLEYLASPTLGEVIEELGKYDHSIPVEISFGDDDLDDDIIHSRYPSGRDGEGTEFLDLQAVWMRATHKRPVAEPESTCILCGADITMGRYGPRGESVWVHKESGIRECREDTAAEGN